MEWLLLPPTAFIGYLILGGILNLVGRMLAGPQKKTSAEKASIYASGEAGPTQQAAPGYRQFFTIALFFAVLHLGILMAGSGGLTAVTGAYLGGLILVLIALILG
jgi:NADH:ubiquinone oxidoreductase subunit 3 (subunit A)